MGMNIHPTSHINSKKTQIERDEEEEEFAFTHSEHVQDQVEGVCKYKSVYMFICMYVYMCTYTYIYEYRYVSIYVQLYVYIHIRICKCKSLYR
jgi:hypothetical protein